MVIARSEATWRSGKIVDTSAILDCFATLAMTEIEFKEVPFRDKAQGWLG
jgi:hypothetical protein